MRLAHDALTDLGYTVFWDQRIPPGQNWDQAIRGHLESARCVLVFWSLNALESPNVRHEALRALDLGTAIPIALDAVKPKQLPLGYYEIQLADLRDWSGDREAANWQAIVKAVAEKLSLVELARVKALLAESEQKLAILQRKRRWVSWRTLGVTLLFGCATIAGLALVLSDRSRGSVATFLGQDTCAPLADGPFSSGAVSYDFCAQGVGRITTEWSKLSEFKGRIGEELFAKLQQDRNSTWYIINMSPYGLARGGKMTPLVTKAHERNIDVKWAFQSSDDAASNRTLQYQWLWLYSGEKTLECRYTKKALCEGVGRFATDAAALSWESRPKVGFPTDARWTTYYTNAPTFYFTLLSVPGRLEDHVAIIERGGAVPPGTFGYVLPYAHFAQYDLRPAFYFDLPKAAMRGTDVPYENTMLQYYFRSTVLYFAEGQKPGRAYLREAPDPRFSNAVIGAVCADPKIPDFETAEMRARCEKPTQ